MKQTSLGLGQSNKRTRRRVFLEEMDRVVPWSELVALISPFMPEGRRGRPPFAVEVMLRIHFMQQWFNLSDPAMEEALHDMALFRDFAGLGGWDERVPDETTILRFRRVLEKHKLAPKILHTINDLLRSKGLMLRAGTVVDATLIAAPSSAVNADLAKKQKASNDAAAELLAANGAVPPVPDRVTAAKKAVSDTTEALDTQKLDVASKKRTLDSATESVKVSEKKLELANGRVKAYATGISQFGPGGQGRLAITDKVTTAVTDIVKTVLSQSGRAEGCLGVISDFVDHPEKYATGTPGEQLLVSCRAIEEFKTVERLMKSGVDLQTIPQLQQQLRIR